MKEGSCFADPYIAGDKLKRRMQEVLYDPLWALDEAMVQGLWSWGNSTENPNETRRNGTTNIGRQFFRDLLEVGTWISNKVFISYFNFFRFLKILIYSRSI